MQLISASFFAFWVVLAVVYYLLKKQQWVVLLLGSLFFFFLVSGGPPILPVLSAGICFGYGKLAKKETRFRKGGLVASVLLLVAILILCRHLLPSLSWLPLLGISFYTMTALAYCIDVYRGTTQPEENYAKLLLVLFYFPSLLQGPIHRYGNVASELFSPHQFSYEKCCFGGQRVLWGLMKKLVLVPRLAIFTDAVFAERTLANAPALVLGTGCFFLELYADWSGYMDLVLGVSETFGISMAENFRQPFFSESIAEVWRRWHITLGAWFRDYIYIPLGGNRKGKVRQIGNLFIVWLLTGLWHGATGGYLLWGLYFAVLSALGVLFHKAGKYDKIKRTFAGRAWRILLTWLLTAAGFFFFAAEDLPTVSALLSGAAAVPISVGLTQTFLTVRALLTKQDVVLIGVVLLLWLLVSRCKERSIGVRERIAGIRLPLRWLLWFALLFFVILYGRYGQQYDAASFMYQNF